MRSKPALALIIVASFCMHARAATISIYTPDWNSIDFGVYNELGLLADYAEAHLSAIGHFQVDLDEDGTADAWRHDYSFVSHSYGLQPRKYSIAMMTTNGSSSTPLGWSNLYTFTQDVVLNSNDFTATIAPVDVGASPLAINGMLDVQGNLLQFGTLDWNSQDDGTPYGVRFTLNPYTVTFDTAIPRAFAVPHMTNKSRITWSFPPSSSSSSFNPPMIPRMILNADGVLTLRNDVGSQINIDPNTGSIAIGANIVMTANQLSAGTMSPSLLSLKLGGATTVASGSLAAGLQSSATGQYSYAVGVSSVANSYGMAAFGRYNALSSGQSISTWTATDDLFVIGNGSSSTNRSNAVTIKKDGTTSLHGSVSIGTPSAGSLSFLGGPGLRSLSVGAATTGTDLLIAAGGASSLDNPGGTLILSGGAVQAGGAESAGSSILFKTADTNNGGVPTTRLSVDVGGNVIIGATAAALIGQKGQLVIGSHNVAQPGSFVVGAGSGVSGDPDERRNALRVRQDGAVLIRPSGDIDMGEFDAGEQP